MGDFNGGGYGGGYGPQATPMGNMGWGQLNPGMGRPPTGGIMADYGNGMGSQLPGQRQQAQPGSVTAAVQAMQQGSPYGMDLLRQSAGLPPSQVGGYSSQGPQTPPSRIYGQPQMQQPMLPPMSANQQLMAEVGRGSRAFYGAPTSPYPNVTGSPQMNALAYQMQGNMGGGGYGGGYGGGIPK